MGLSDEQRRELARERIRAVKCTFYYLKWTTAGGCPYYFKTEFRMSDGWLSGSLWTEIIRRDMTNFGDVK